MFRLNYIFGHDVVKKIGLDAVLLQENTGLEQITTYKGQKDQRRSEEDEARKDDFVKETGTPRMVLFLRGEGCNIPLICP